MIRVRFAPSPTGSLHIGGARTALFNWVYAKAKHGEFILRIEDTDAQRSKQEFVDEILESLRWLGFNWDDIFYQSSRLDIYKEHAQRLLQEKKAYIQRTEDRGEKAEAIIFKIEPQKIKINDLIRGAIEFDTTTIKDQVLIKSDGTATYNFACVVDDALMKITHVIRGDDHISNTPKQVLLYQAMGFSIPNFAHLPLILGTEGRLSKRTGATAISDYRKMGYLPETLVNYLLLLSWSPGENQEIINTEEAIKLFDIKDVNKTAATFDMKKLDWMNNQYLKKADPEELTDLLLTFLIEKGYIDKDKFDRNYIVSLVKLFQGRLSKLSDFAEWADFFFLEEVKMEEAAKNKFLTQDFSKEFKLFIERLETLDDFSVTGIETCFREMVKELNLQAKALIHPMRVALTGKTVGPGLFEVIYYLGKERTKQRLMKWSKKGVNL